MISFKNNYITSLFIVFLFYLPIYLIDKPFTDDYARNIRGYFGWSGDGRPLADIAIYIINFGSNLTDTSPLSSILAVLICALTCAIISYNIAGSSAFVTIAAASSLIVSPFFFHNALY
ncbi:glucosyltransferase domain-containing protein, partial [Escherichia coli]